MGNKKKKQKCCSCGKVKVKGVILVGQEKEYFICEECWREEYAEEEES